MSRAFTLLEVLAAVMVLGLLAAALVPLVLHQGRGQGRISDEIAARTLLSQALATSWRPAAGERREVADHPGWWIEVRPLDASGTTTTDAVRPTHRWLVVTIGDGVASRPFAERLVLTSGVGP